MRSCLLLWLFVPVLFAIPGGVAAERVWPQPRPVYQAPNIDFKGVGCQSSAGGYALIWKEKRTNDWNSLYYNHHYFQRFDSLDQPILPEPVAVFSAWGQKTITQMVETSDNGFVFATDGGSRLFKINSTGEQQWGSGVSVPHMSSTNRLLADHQGGVYQFSWSGSQSGYWFLSHWNSSGSHTGNTYVGLNPINTSSDSNIQVSLLPNDDLICSFVWNSGIRIVKVSPLLDIIWAQTGYPDEGSVVKIQPTQISSTDHRVIYRTNQDGAQIWKSFVVNGDGNTIWTEPLILFSEDIATTISAMDAAGLSNNSTLLAWSIGNTLQCVVFSPQGSLSLQGCTTTLNQEPAYYDQQIKLVPDYSGGAYLHVTRISTAGYTHSLAQYINNSGFVLASEALLSFTSHPDFGSPGRSMAPLVYASEGRLCVIFELIVPGYSHLIKREMTSSGAVSPPVSVSDSLYRTCTQPQVSAIGNNVLTAWVDNEFLDQNTYNQLRIRYQIIDPSGNFMLQNWGLIPASGEYRNIGTFRLHSLGTGNMLIVWSDLTEPVSIRAQLITASGEQLWEPAGRLIAAGDQYMDLAHGFASTIWEENLYVFWTSYANAVFEIRGQRLNNGQPQWETNGRILISSVDFPGDDYSLFSSARVINAWEDYLVWGRWDLMTLGQAIALKWIRILRFNEDGMPQPGFDSTGNLAFCTYDSYVGLSLQQAVLTPQGLLLEAGFGQWQWYGYPGDGGYISFAEYRLQLVDPVGEPQWGNGYTIASNISYYRGLLVAADEQGYILHTDLGLVRYDYQHEPLWTSNLASFTHRGAVEVAPGYYIGLADKLKYYTFTALGDASQPADCVLDNREQASSICTTNHNAYVAWADLSLYNIPSYTSVWLQRLHYFTSGTNDPHTPELDQVSILYYPNPFKGSMSLVVDSDVSRALDISVYNIRGQLVRNLFTGDIAKGSNMITWDGRNLQGNDVSPGVYICAVRSNNNTLKRFKLCKY